MTARKWVAPNLWAWVKILVHALVHVAITINMCVECANTYEAHCICFSFWSQTGRPNGEVSEWYDTIIHGSAAPLAPHYRTDSWFRPECLIAICILHLQG